MPEPRPLYRLPELIEAPVVYLTEGEKAADAARSIGLIATTSPHGSQSASKADWTPLAGKKVVQLPDNDVPGRTYADEVRSILLNLNPPAQVVEVDLPGLAEGDDIVEWIDNHGDAATPETMRRELERLVSETEQTGESATVTDDEPPAVWKPFPVDLLPAPVGDLVRAAAAAMRCDTALIALPVLAVLAAAIGLTRTLRIKSSWHAVSILWLAVVAESGSLKSPALRIALSPLRQRERQANKRYEAAREAYDAALVIHEASISKWKRANKGGEPPLPPEAPIAERFTTSNTTIEALATILQENPRGVLIAVDELAGWFGSFDRYSSGKAGGDSAGWLPMYNGEVLAVDRKTGTAPRIYVPRAGVSVVGTIQPGILKKNLGTEHRDSGLAARLQMASPPRTIQSWSEDDVDRGIEVAYADVVAWLCNLSFAMNDQGESVPVALGMTPEAKRLWIDHYNAHATEQAELSGDMAAAWSKLQEIPARLALILHLTRVASEDTTVESANDVDAHSMQAGIELAQWFKNEAKRVYRRLDESDGDGDERRLIEWITNKGGTVTERDVQRGCSWLSAAGMAEEALQELVTRRRGKWEWIPTTTKGGRPSREFHLKAKPRFDTTQETPEES